MSAKIQTQYEVLQTLIQQFEQEANERQARLKALGQCVAQLQEGAWVSPAADAFFAEMHAIVLPASNALAKALYQGSGTLNQVAQIFHEAEEKARDKFKHAPDTNGTPQGAPPPAAPVPPPAPPAAAPKSAPPPAPAPTTHVWDKFVGQHSDRNQGWGCVAYVLNSAYIPWVTPSHAPGDATQWLNIARDYMKQHPEMGITIDQTPSPGAVAVWPYMGTGKDANGKPAPYGHVAKVTAANGDHFTWQSGDTWHNGQGVAQGHWYSSSGQLDGVNTVNTSVSGQHHPVYFIHFPWSTS